MKQSTPKRVIYRARHRKLKHIEPESTMHGFEHRIRVATIGGQGLRYNPAYYGVLHQGEITTVEATSSNYRRVPFGPENDKSARKSNVSPLHLQAPSRDYSTMIQSPSFYPQCSDNSITTFSDHEGTDPVQLSTTPFSHPFPPLYNGLSNEGHTEIGNSRSTEPRYPQSLFDPNFNPNFIDTIDPSFNCNVTPSGSNFRPTPLWDSPSYSDYEDFPPDHYSSDFYSLFPEYHDNFHAG